MWECRYFPSGTCIVCNLDAPQEAFAYGVRSLEPHFYIYGPRGRNESETIANRYRVCEDIRDFMNGGKRPKWLDDMERTSEDSAIGLDGTSIRSTGPSIDTNPPHCCWEEDKSIEAVNARARLMDRLFGIESKV